MYIVMCLVWFWYVNWIWYIYKLWIRFEKCVFLIGKYLFIFNRKLRYLLKNEINFLKIEKLSIVKLIISYFLVVKIVNEFVNKV